MVIIKPSKNQQRKLQRRWRQKARMLAEAERRRLESLPKPRVKVIKAHRGQQ